MSKEEILEYLKGAIEKEENFSSLFGRSYPVICGYLEGSIMYIIGRLEEELIKECKKN